MVGKPPCPTSLETSAASAFLACFSVQRYTTPRFFEDYVRSVSMCRPTPTGGALFLLNRSQAHHHGRGPSLVFHGNGWRWWFWLSGGWWDSVWFFLLICLVGGMGIVCLRLVSLLLVGLTRRFRDDFSTSHEPSIVNRGSHHFRPEQRLTRQPRERCRAHVRNLKQNPKILSNLNCTHVSTWFSRGRRNPGHNGWEESSKIFARMNWVTHTLC